MYSAFSFWTPYYDSLCAGEHSAMPEDQANIAPARKPGHEVIGVFLHVSSAYGVIKWVFQGEGWYSHPERPFYTHIDG